MIARLSGFAVSNWATLDGYAVGHGLPELRELPLERFINFAWWFATRNADPKEVDSFKARLWVPPKGEEPAAGSPWSRESEMAAFDAVRSQLGLN